MEDSSSVTHESGGGGGEGRGEGGGVMSGESEDVMVELEEVLDDGLAREVGTMEVDKDSVTIVVPPTSTQSSDVGTVPYTLDSGTLSQQDITAALMKEAGPTTTSTSPMLAAAVSAEPHISPSMKEAIISFTGKYSVNQAAKRFSIPASTIKTWIKGENVHVRPKFNSPGQGRKLSYSKETDQAIADHVKSLLARGESMSVQDLCNYAKKVIQEENPNFNASTGWAQRFLPRHGINLGSRGRKESEPIVSSAKLESRGVSDSRGRPLSYSTETDQAIAEYVRERQAEGTGMGNSELRRYAKEMIQKENPNFTGSASWAQNFFLRHKLNLHSPSPGEKDATSAATASSSLDVLNSPPLHLSPHSPPPMSHIASSIGTTPLEPVAEITPTSVSAVLGDAGPSVDSDFAGVPVSDDPMKAALAILTGENIDTSSFLNSAQAAALQSTLNELTAAESISLVDLLNNAQQLQDQSSGDGTVALITQALEPPAGSSLFLGGLSGTSEAFATGLTGAAATQVNPNTQAPLFTFPRMNILDRVLDLPQVTNMRSTDTIQANRPLSYAKETDQLLANWVQEQQAAGKKVTFASLRAYAKKLVSNENPNFNASVGWVTPFLLRHNLDLSVNKKKKQPRKSTPRKIAASSPSDGKETYLDESDNPDGPDGELMGDESSRGDDELDNIVASTGSVQMVPAAAPMDQVLQHPAVPLEELTIQVAENPLSSSSSLQPLPTTSQEQPVLSDRHTDILPSPLAPPGPSHTLTENPLLETAMEVPGEKLSVSAKKTKGQRARHTLAEKLEVVRLMKEYNIAAHHVCRMLGLANSTVAGWIKLVNQKGAELEHLSVNKKRANVSGQGRPLSYSREKDEAIARWVRAEQALGGQVTSGDLTKYATTLIGQENATFTASSGWQQKFLQRHNLQLTPRSENKPSPLVEEQHNIPAPVQTEEVTTHEFTTNLLEKPYSDTIEEQLVQWVKKKIAEGEWLPVQDLCRKAEELVVSTNPAFVATLGWAFKFLHRQGLMLDPKPSSSSTSLDSPMIPRKRLMEAIDTSLLSTPKKSRIDAPDVSVSPSTGNLCEALLALSNHSQEGMEGVQTVQAAVQAMQNAVKAIQSQQAQVQQQEASGGSLTSSQLPEEQSSPSPAANSTYFGKPAREFSPEEKEEVVRYANATTLQKAALKYGVAAPTVWRWRVELKLHQPKYTPMQKKYIIKFAETNSLREASQRYGITGKTIQNWRRALQAEGEMGSSGLLVEDFGLEVPGEGPDSTAATGEGTSSEMVAYDTQNFQIVVDGGEVVETSGAKETAESQVNPLKPEVTHEVDIENVGMEYDVISSEGHAAKPRCTHQEKVQILNFALKHSIKEASQKFGISPGTLYYWKKSFSSGEKPPGAQLPPPSSTASSSSSAPLSSADPIIDVEFPRIATDTLVSLAPATGITAEGLGIPPEQLLSASAAATPENLQALSQTLANMTPEALQSLPADISLLQAVSSLLSQQGTETDDGGISLQKGAKPPRRVSQRETGSAANGGISSPTEVLVTPFQPPVSVPHVASTEEVELMETTDDITVTTASDEIPPPPPVPSTTSSSLSLQISEITSEHDQPIVGESVEIKTGPPPTSSASSSLVASHELDEGNTEESIPEVTEVVVLGNDTVEVGSEVKVNAGN